MIDKEKLEHGAYVLKSIAHPTRLAVIMLLQQNEQLTVNEMVALTGCEQSLLSHHLSNMRIKGILAQKRVGTNIYYSLKAKQLFNVLECIENCKINM
ncbi:MAG: ArsR/SmtB family transcription factor [Bacteroidia bacterium]